MFCFLLLCFNLHNVNQKKKEKIRTTRNTTLVIHSSTSSHLAHQTMSIPFSSSVLHQLFGRGIFTHDCLMETCRQDVQLCNHVIDTYMEPVSMTMAIAHTISVCEIGDQMSSTMSSPKPSPEPIGDDTLPVIVPKQDDCLYYRWKPKDNNNNPLIVTTTTRTIHPVNNRCQSPHTNSKTSLNSNLDADLHADCGQDSTSNKHMPCWQHSVFAQDDRTTCPQVPSEVDEIWIRQFVLCTAQRMISCKWNVDRVNILAARDHDAHDRCLDFLRSYPHLFSEQERGDVYLMAALATDAVGHLEYTSCYADRAWCCYVRTQKHYEQQYLQYPPPPPPRTRAVPSLHNDAKSTLRSDMYRMHIMEETIHSNYRTCIMHKWRAFFCKYATHCKLYSHHINTVKSHIFEDIIAPQMMQIHQEIIDVLGLRSVWYQQYRRQHLPSTTHHFPDKQGNGDDHLQQQFSCQSQTVSPPSRTCNTPPSLLQHDNTSDPTHFLFTADFTAPQQQASDMDGVAMIFPDALSLDSHTIPDIHHPTPHGIDIRDPPSIFLPVQCTEDYTPPLDYLYHLYHCSVLYEANNDSENSKRCIMPCYQWARWTFPQLFATREETREQYDSQPENVATTTTTFVCNMSSLLGHDKEDCRCFAENIVLCMYSDDVTAQLQTQVQPKFPSSFNLPLLRNLCEVVRSDHARLDAQIRRLANLGHEDDVVPSSVSDTEKPPSCNIMMHRFMSHQCRHYSYVYLRNTLIQSDILPLFSFCDDLARGMDYLERCIAWIRLYYACQAGTSCLDASLPAASWTLPFSLQEHHPFGISLLHQDGEDEDCTMNACFGPLHAHMQSTTDRATRHDTNHTTDTESSSPLSSSSPYLDGISNSITTTVPVLPYMSCFATLLFHRRHSPMLHDPHSSAWFEYQFWRRASAIYERAREWKKAIWCQRRHLSIQYHLSRWCCPRELSDSHFHLAKLYEYAGHYTQSLHHYTRAKHYIMDELQRKKKSKDQDYTPDNITISTILTLGSALIDDLRLQSRVRSIDSDILCILCCQSSPSTDVLLRETCLSLPADDLLSIVTSWIGKKDTNGNRVHYALQILRIMIDHQHLPCFSDIPAITLANPSSAPSAIHVLKAVYARTLFHVDRIQDSLHVCDQTLPSLIALMRSLESAKEERTMMFNNVQHFEKFDRVNKLPMIIYDNIDHIPVSNYHIRYVLHRTQFMCLQRLECIEEAISVGKQILRSYDLGPCPSQNIVVPYLTMLCIKHRWDAVIRTYSDGTMYSKQQEKKHAMHDTWDLFVYERIIQACAHLECDSNDASHKLRMFGYGLVEAFVDTFMMSNKVEHHLSFNLAPLPCTTITTTQSPSTDRHVDVDDDIRVPEEEQEASHVLHLWRWIGSHQTQECLLRAMHVFMRHHVTTRMTQIGNHRHRILHMIGNVFYLLSLTHVTLQMTCTASIERGILDGDAGHCSIGIPPSYTLFIRVMVIFGMHP